MASDKPLQLVQSQDIIQSNSNLFTEYVNDMF